jgi:uncharacterized OB-fold protein
VYSFTVNHQPWDGTADSHIVGVVEMDEQPSLRLMTNVVDVAPNDMRIGMPVEVVFEDHTPVYLPVFRPVACERSRAPSRHLRHRSVAGGTAARP